MSNTRLDSGLKAARWVITGRVQGVSYRVFAREEALRLQLTGWVRNLPDGSVEIWVAGDSEVLERFRATLLEGPRFASVEGLAEDPLDPDQLVRELGHRAFEIRWT